MFKDFQFEELYATNQKAFDRISSKITVGLR